MPVCAALPFDYYNASPRSLSPGHLLPLTYNDGQQYLNGWIGTMLVMSGQVPGLGDEELVLITMVKSY